MVRSPVIARFYSSRSQSLHSCRDWTAACAYSRPVIVGAEQYDNPGRSIAATIAVDPDWLVSFEQNDANCRTKSGCGNV